jgi:hypothetical protein
MENEEEYHSVCSLVRIGPAHPHLSRKQASVSLSRNQGGRSNTPLRVRGWADAIRTTWHFV